MKIRWLGHSAFLITSDGGTRIITDPYKSGILRGLRYGEIHEWATIVTVSHKHVDHNNVSAVLGNPRLIDTVSTYEVKGIQFRGIAAYHDNAEGRKRGPNTIFRFEVDGIRLCHLGDLGHQLTDEQVAAIGEVDVLLIPVGGRFTIDATGASQVIEKLKPKVAIPMHYKTDKCLIPLARIDPFLEGKPNVKRLDASEVEFKKEELPSPTEIVVLKHAL